MRQVICRDKAHERRGAEIMQVIGITGGVGAGKSAILEYLQENYKVKNLEADRIAERLMEPGTECYEQLLKFLPVEI